MSKSDRTAVVTGAGRGLGRHLTLELLRRGWRVFATVREGSAHDLPQEKMLTVQLLDQADPESIAEFSIRIKELRLDLLLINAAIRGDTRGLAGFDAQDFLQVMATNVAGPLLLVQHLINQIPASGKIAFISSRAGSMAQGADPDGDYAYCASKAALNRMMVKLADDYGQTFLALHPGWLRTDMGGAEAPVDPAASASALLALIDRATHEDSGCFRAWDGTNVAW